MFNRKKKILTAIGNKEAGVVASMLAKVKDINETFSKPDNKDVEGWTFVFHACKYGNLEIVELLLKNDADLNITDSDGKSTLYWAACNDDDGETADIVKKLIEESVDINKPANDGRTALVGAVINGNFRAIEVLLAAGAHPNILMSDGRTSLHIAVQQGEIKFWSVRMRPAKPLAFGTLNTQNGRKVPHIGLPGNPVSALVAFEQFCRPAILKMLGRTELNKPTITAILRGTITNYDERRVYARVLVSKSGNNYYAVPTGPQGSNILTSVSRANGLAICPQDVPEINDGQTVSVQMLDWPEQVEV